MYLECSKNILLITSFDSFLKVGVSLCQDLDYSHLDIKIRLTQPNQLSCHQLASAIDNSQNTKLSCFYHHEIENIDFSSYDIVVLSIGNVFHKFLFNYLNKKNLRKDVFIISLFPGVIFGDYESILTRIQSDILLVNNMKDYHAAVKIKEEYKQKVKIINYGLIQAKKYHRQVTKQQNIYYIDQVIVPKTYKERFYILEKLVELANKHRDKQFFIKGRIKANERTVHDNHYPLELLLNDIAINVVIPNNLAFTYEPIELCLEKASLMMTVSSTVALEAMYNDIPVAIIADFGIDASLLNKEFYNSGCFTKIADIFHTDYCIDKLWYESMVEFPENRKAILKRYIYSQLQNPIQKSKIVFSMVNNTKKGGLKSRLKRYWRRYKIIISFNMLILRINIRNFVKRTRTNN